MEKIKWAAIALVVGVIIGFSVKPEPEVKIVEKVVKQKEIEEKIVKVERPDGTKVTTIDRRSKERTDSKKLTHKIPSKKDWKVGAGLEVNSNKYYGTVSRRIFGDVYLGATVSQNLAIGVQVEILF